MATLDDLLLTDFAFTDDFAIARGDFDVVSGTRNLRGAILRRLLIVPGTLLHRPDYGCGILAFQNAPATVDSQRQIAQRVIQQLPQDPRIVAVRSLSVTFDDYTPQSLRIVVTVDALGLGETQLEFLPFQEVLV